MEVYVSERRISPRHLLKTALRVRRLEIRLDRAESRIAKNLSGKRNLFRHG